MAKLLGGCRSHLQTKITQKLKTQKQPTFFEGVGMRTEEEIKKTLKELRKTRREGVRLTEAQSIAWHGTKQALEWVLKQTDTLLTY